MHFQPHWIRLLMGTVRSVSYTLLLNGQLAGSFSPQCGLRQGGPLSPYLFILGANVLSCMLLRLEATKKIKGISFGNRYPQISHLMYADDIVLFFQPTVDSCQAVAETLRCYACLAGQDINRTKSKIVFSPNVPRIHKKLLASVFGISYLPSLGRYLGSTLDHNSKTPDLFNELLERFNSKLSRWKSKLLSQAGHLTLASSVLQSLPLYQMSVFKFPIHMARKFDSIVANFFWGYRHDRPAMHLSAFTNLSRPKNQGGLGLRSFALTNQALLAKQFWNFYNNQTSLSSHWVIGKYFHGSLHNDMVHTTQPSRVWKSISSCSKLILDHLKWNVGSESHIPLGSKFWWQPLSSIPSEFQVVTLF